VFARTPKLLLHFVSLKCDYLLARCMEKGKQGEEERTAAYKVVRVCVCCYCIPYHVIVVVAIVLKTTN
jgi:hypothetical protein